MRRAIKNSKFQIIGWLEEGNKCGHKVIFAKSFRYAQLGYYDPITNKSYNFYGQFIGVGDLTSSMIWENYQKNPNNMGEK